MSSKKSAGKNSVANAVLWSSFKQALRDFYPIIVASVVSALLFAITLNYEMYVGFAAYFVAVIFMCVGLYVSKENPGGKLSSFLNLLITSLVCISFTYNATVLLASLLMRNEGFFSESEFVNKFSSSEPVLEMLAMACIPSFAVVFANRWMDEKSKFAKKVKVGGE